MENAQPKKKMSRGKKAGIIVGAILALLIAAVLVYGFVLTRTGYWLIAKFTPDTPEQQLSYTSASDTVRQIAEEGFVLMQNNDGLLPLASTAENPGKINLFGIRSIQMLYAGGDLSLDFMAAFKLPGGDDQKNRLLAAAENPDTKVGFTLELQRASKDILYAVSNTWKVQ